MITFDPNKNERNIRERGLPFEMAGRMIWSEASIGVSRSQEPAATRFVAVGEIDDERYVVVFVIEGSDTRVISLRRASKQEDKRWHAARTRG